MTTSYYAPVEKVQGDVIELPDEEARHAVKVLRTRPGDEIVVVDGAGGWYRVRVDRTERGVVAGTILETQRDVGEPAYKLTVGLGLLKNPARFETFLEKAVELGVSRVVPLVTERTEKGRIKENRAQNILIAAMKQSGRSRLIDLQEPVAFEAFVRGSAFDLALICHEATDPERAFMRVLSAHAAARRIVVMVGPEGGFGEGEVALASVHSFLPVSLGSRRLRAETAALTAAAGVMLARS